MAIESFSNAAATGTSSRRAGGRSHEVLRTLRKEIVLGQLEPEAPVLELELAQRFGCSQGSVREALLALNEEGLVNRVPNRGTHVAPSRVADAQALLTIRHDIECRHLERVLEGMEPPLRSALNDQLNAMRNAARDGDEYLLSAHDRQFHATLFRAADLPAVSPILTRCLIHNHRYKILNSQPNRELEETAERHVPILAALDRGDVDELRRVLSHHIATIVDFGPDLTGEGMA